jgi:hypothetical protein
MRDSDFASNLSPLRTIWWRDLLPTLPRPVFALGTSDIYRVMVHGSGFKLPLEDGSSAVGFFTTRYVAASTASDAKQIAAAVVHGEWRGRGHENAVGSVMLAIEEHAALSERFRLRSATGFVFYAQGEDCEALAISKMATDEA